MALTIANGCLKQRRKLVGVGGRDSLQDQENKRLLSTVQCHDVRRQQRVWRSVVSAERQIRSELGAGWFSDAGWSRFNGMHRRRIVQEVANSRSRIANGAHAKMSCESQIPLRYPASEPARELVYDLLAS